MRPLPAALESRLRAVASTVRIITEARVEQSADLRQTGGGSAGANGAPIGWADCDGGLPAGVQIMDDGSLTLVPTNSAAIGSTVVSTGSTFYRDGASGPHSAGSLLIDPPTTRYGTTTVNLFQDISSTPSMGVGLQFTGTQVNTIYPQIQAWLHPQFDATKPISVGLWQLTVYRVASTGGGVRLTPVAQATVPVASAVAGWVVFSFQDGNKKPVPFSPKQGGFVGPLGTPASFQYLLVAEGFDGQGLPAQNIGWGYDSGHTSFTQGSAPNQIAFTGSSIAVTKADAGLFFLVGTRNIPALQLIPATYSASAVTLTFKTGKWIDLGSVPASPPECVLRGSVPTGCTLQGQVEQHVGGPAFQTFTDGQTVDTLGTPLSTLQAYDIQVTLQANAAQDQAPILSTLGMRVATGVDLGEECTISSWSEEIDPITHSGAIGEVQFHVLHDGVRDFRDKITLLLSQNPPSNFFFRVWMGDRRIPKANWLHLDDYLIDDQQDVEDGVLITGVSVLQYLRTMLPTLSSDVSAYPTTDVSNAGAWTTVGAPSTNPLSGALADLSASSVLTVPNDTTYVQSVVTPASAQFEVNLAAIGAPPLNAGVVIQLRVAVVGAGASVNINAALRSGGVTRATLPATAVTTQDTGQGSYVPLQYFLTATEIANITAAAGWGGLSLRFTASSTAGTNPQIRVGWARVVQLGNRAAVQYPSSAVPTPTIQAVLADLLNNRAALDRRYNGVSFTDAPTNPLTVAKTISQASGSGTDLSRLLTELNALAWIGGFGFCTSQGRIKTPMLYQVTTGKDPLVGDVTASFAMKQGKLAAIFPLEEVQPLQITPGWRHRVPVFGVPWGWNGSTYAGEAQVAGQGVTFFPAALIDPEPRLNQTTALWINNDGLARGLAIRHVLAFGLGLALWRFRATYRYPELELGDLVALQTDQFIAYDPIATQAIAGKRWVTAVVVGRHDAEGREFTVWVQGYSGLRLVASATAFPPLNPLNPIALGVSGYVGEQAGTAAGDNLSVFWSGVPAVAAVKIAVSTVSQPAAGTGTVYAGRQGVATVVGPYAFGTTIYVTITPYDTVDASDQPGAAANVLKLIDGSSISTPYNNQGSILPNPVDFTFSYNANAGDGTTNSSFAWTWPAGHIYLPDGTSITVPASSALSVPAAPTLSQVAGGALGARTRYVRVAYYKQVGNGNFLYGISAEASLAISANNLLKVTAPAAAGGYNGWVVLVGAATNLEFTQLTGPSTRLAFGADWTEPAGGAIVASASNTTPFKTNWVGAVVEYDRGYSATYRFYPYWDVAFAALQANGCGIVMNGDDSHAVGTFATETAAQQRDGHLGLVLTVPATTTTVVGYITAIMPAASGSGSGGGGGKF